MGDIRNKIGLGTVQFGMEYGISNQSGQTPPNEVSAILASFRKKGGNLIDTAIAYGSSEIVLGNAGVGEFSVISKRSEEHTSELQSRGHLVCRLLLEKKKQVVEGWMNSEGHSENIMKEDFKHIGVGYVEG